MSRWTKYDYLCTDCDALIEVTAWIDVWMDPACICGGLQGVILLTKSDAFGPILEPVTNITPRKVVKINTNPYN
jgi:hypothetical protein